MKLLIIDDHPIVLEGLQRVLSAEGYNVEKASTAAEARKAVELNADIGVIIVDLTLQKSADGLDLIKEIKSMGNDSPVVVYTMHEELWNVATLMEAGVEGIVLKGDSIDELLEAVRVVGNGGAFRSSVFSDRLEVLKNSKGILSQRDMKILDMISRGDNTGGVAKKMFITEKAVEYHRSLILKKLGSKNMTEAIRQAVKLGIISCVAMFAGAQSHATVPEAVDLGLSVMWGDRNLGADTPLGAGGYYAFGETSEKGNYDWSTYEHCDDGDMFSQHVIGDGSICGTEYDAAHVILGGGWRMPSYDEMQELMDNCQFDIIEGDGMPYARFTSDNGAYIEIPYVGYMSKSKVAWEGVELEIWTGYYEVEAGEEDGFVYYLNLPYAFASRIGSPDAPEIMDMSVHLGFQIRPVYAGTVGVSVVDSEVPVLTDMYTLDGKKISGSVTDLPSGIYILRYSDGSTHRIIK